MIACSDSFRFRSSCAITVSSSRRSSRRVQAGELLDDAVEPTEQRLELAVRDLSVLHVGEVIVVAHKRANGEGTRCKSGTVPPL